MGLPCHAKTLPRLCSVTIKGKAIHTIMHLFRPVILPVRAALEEHAAGSFVKGRACTLRGGTLFQRDRPDRLPQVEGKGLGFNEFSQGWPAFPVLKVSLTLARLDIYFSKDLQK